MAIAMKCDNETCSNEATVHLTQIVDGKMSSANFCEHCAKEKGITDPTGYQLAEFLMGAGGQKKGKGTETGEDALACPECGFTRAHLKKIGRLGCPECYRTFADDLDNMLRAMHKGTRHIGKSPGLTLAPVATQAQLKKRLGDLKQAIEKAVAEERYEDAARLRDEMKEMENHHGT
jgi:protein arginine kinase activator